MIQSRLTFTDITGAERTFGYIKLWHDGSKVGPLTGWIACLANEYGICVRKAFLENCPRECTGWELIQLALKVLLDAEEIGN